MQKIGSITPTADVNGEWTNGNVAGGIAPTTLDAAWFNTVQRELAGVVTGSGLTLDPTNDGQVLAGLKLLMNKALTGVVGATRNAAMSIATASASATFTANELIVETSAGTQYRLNAFNKTINLATVGAGGIDTGAVPPSGFIAIYAIYNPTTATSALLAVDTSSVVAPEIYSGTNMPAGYTASALVSIWRTSSSLMVSGYQSGRNLFLSSLGVINSTSTASTANVLTYSTTAFPKNAKTISGYGTLTPAAGQLAEIWLLSQPAINFGMRFAVNGQSINSFGIATPFNQHPITTPQTLYVSAFSSNGASFPYGINLSGYSF